MIEISVANDIYARIESLEFHKKIQFDEIKELQSKLNEVDKYECQNRSLIDELKEEIKMLNNHIDKLHDMINMEDRITASDVLIRLILLETHKNYQIDENRKVSRKLDECISEIGELKSKKANANLVAHHYIEFKTRLEELSISIQDVEINLDKLGTQWIESIRESLKEIERFQEITRLQYKKATGQVDTFPHKCPVCDGSGWANISNSKKWCKSCYEEMMYKYYGTIIIANEDKKDE